MDVLQINDLPFNNSQSHRQMGGVMPMGNHGQHHGGVQTTPVPVGHSRSSGKLVNTGPNHPPGGSNPWVYVQCSVIDINNFTPKFTGNPPSTSDPKKSPRYAFLVPYGAKQISAPSPHIAAKSPV